MHKFLTGAALPFLVVGLFTLVGVAHAAKVGLDARQNSRLTIEANAGGRNCVKYMDITQGPGAGGTVRILAGGTTIYAVDLSSGGGMIRDWDDQNALQMPCTRTFNQILEIYVDTGTYRMSTLTVLK